MDLAGLVHDLGAEARRTNQRRLLVLAGGRERGTRTAFSCLADADVSPQDATVVTTRDEATVHGIAREEGFSTGPNPERLHPAQSDALLGRTRMAVVLDAHERFSPNALGRVVGAVDGGGLLVLIAPPLSEWPGRVDDFDDGLAVPPYTGEDVAERFRSRLVDTLTQHDGIAVVDVDRGVVERRGETDDAERSARRRPTPPRTHAFPDVAYEACLTADQSRAVAALERLEAPGNAVVVESDRGRGKSSAAGIAAGAHAAEGRDVLVTAPGFENARQVFVRAHALLTELDALSAVRGFDPDDVSSAADEAPAIDAVGSGRVRFLDPPTAAELHDAPDVVLVDEAAALPVRLLSRFLDAPAVGFCTTVHGYEGAGRGFSVRFREKLAESRFAVEEVHLAEPIRYAAGDPVEAWAFRALLLDARPAVEPLVEDATPETADYEALDPASLVADEHRLREVFGLLVLAHYRTEPDDLARLLDAPNLRIRALLHDGHVAAVALLAEEGGLPAATRRDIYDGSRIRGHMLPDVLTSQLRDEDAGRPTGYRVMRIATHHAVRSRGLGSRLLREVRAEFGDDVDWLGVGYGATPELLSFWAANGYRTVHVSTTRNDTSGEYSALMLAPTSDAGRRLAERHERWFLDRADGVLGDPLRDADADVVRAALDATDASADASLSEREWRVATGAAYGPGLYVTAPGAFARLALAHLTDPDSTALSATEERLLVRKVLQRRPWDDVAEELGYVSTSQCMRALGEAYQPLVDRFGDGVDVVREERARYRSG